MGLTPVRYIASTLTQLRHQRSLLERPRVRTTGLLLAVVIFVGGLATALAAHPRILGRIDLQLWLLVLPCIPLTILLNATQFWVTTHMMRTPASLGRAALVTVLSTAANVLPIPGGSIIRIAALKDPTNTYQDATTVTLLTGATWASVALLLAGATLPFLDRHAASIFTLGSGAFLLVIATLLLRRRAPGSDGWLGMLLLTQAALVVVGTTRLWLCLLAIGQALSFLAIVPLSMSSIISALVGFAPAGLGVTELSAAGIAFAIGLAPSAAFLAAAVNRISGLLVVSPVAWLLSIRQLQRSALLRAHLRFAARD